MRIKNINKLPPVIDLLINSECNLNCQFCFGPKPQKRVSFKELKDLIEKLARLGVKNVIISGGEPLLYKNIEELLCYCKKNNLKIVLSTNGISLAKRLDAVLPHIDWLNLPMEASSSNLHCQLRPGFPDHLGYVIKLIKVARKKYPRVKIKIGTVVTKRNFNGLEKIAKLMVENKILPDTWKLYQFAARGKGGSKNKNEFYISTKEFLSKSKKAKQILRKASKKTRVVVKPNRDFEKADLFVNPNGDAVCVIKGKYRTIGNFVKNFDGVIGQWQKFVNIKALVKHHNLTYKDILREK